MDFVLNSFAILFVGTIDDMGEVKVFHLDFDDNYDLIGYGEYALIHSLCTHYALTMHSLYLLHSLYASSLSRYGEYALN
jgi:hypothetical protein